MNNFISTLVDYREIDPIGMKPIWAMQLLTVAIVNEEGQTLNLISSEFNPTGVDERLLQLIVDEKENSEAYKTNGVAYNDLSSAGKINYIQREAGVTHYRMRKKIAEFTGVSGYLYGYLPYIDFAAISPFVDLRNYYTRDLKQMVDETDAMIGDGYFSTENDKYPFPREGALTALEKAQWHKKLYEYVTNLRILNNI